MKSVLLTCLLLAAVTACEFSSAGVTAGSTDGTAADGDAVTDGPTAIGNPVQLGLAANYVVLAKAGISGTTATVTGNLGVSPAAATYVTGFSLIADASNMFSTSAQVTGRVYAADYVTPTPSALTTAVLDMELAFTDAAARAPDVLELGAGDIGGMTLAPGVYPGARASRSRPASRSRAMPARCGSSRSRRI